MIQTSTATAAWGEAFSNYEEYMVYYDDGSWVNQGSEVLQEPVMMEPYSRLTNLHRPNWLMR